jgi:Flp pilus assembly protein TadG
MLRSQRQPARRGATVVECAIVLPATFMLMFTMMIGAMGVFRYHEVATLAREGARYASTHGYQYRKDSGQEMGTKDEWTQEIYDNAIKPKLVALDTARLGHSVSWPDVVNQPGKPDNWPGSKVDVTVTYTWMPEWRFLGPITLTSTSSMPITN